MPSEYVDFEVIISPLAESRYHVAASGPGGQARGVLTLPTDEPQFRALLERLERLETDHAALVAMGDALFGRLFQDTIEHILVASQALLGPDQSLRLKLNVDAALPEVIRLPWELLRDQRGPLALLDAPIVRFLPLPVRAPTLPVDPPLRVLLSAAQTPPPAGVERELREVQSALEALGDRVQIVVEPHLTARRLQQHLRAGFHIWHFVGHGSVSGDGAGQIVFEDEAGDSAPLTAPELQIYLNRSGVRLIVLNACQGARLSTDPFHSMAPALIRAQVPAVVAMQFSVPEETARAFAGEFYRTLAEGWPIDACVTEARKAVMAICGLGRADWAIPVVYTRAPDGQLFPRTAVPAPAPPPTPAPAPAAPAPPPPPAAQPEAPLNNLPAQPTGIFGRDQDAAAVIALLLRPDVRLITLTGPGGGGKTRLAVHVAEQLLDRYPHGVAFVNLSSASWPDQVLPAIAQAIGVQERGGRSLLACVKEWLRERKLLLVLDTFDRLIDAAPLIGDLLAAAPHLDVIVTSRTVLRISAEYAVPVQPLPLPDLRRLPPPDQLALNPAVALFVERTRAVRPGFALTAENARDVAEICARLDGLPLAIELAAALTRVLYPPSALLAELSNRLDLLTGGARDREARQRALRDTIAWSYDLLDEDERALFTYLSVFDGGFTRAAAEEVVGGLYSASVGEARAGGGRDRLVTLARLMSLVDHSLLRQADHSGEVRFQMLATIRDFGLERLYDRGEAERLRRHHAAYFLRLAAEADAGLSGPEQGRWLQRLDLELFNLRAALSWAREQPAAEHALRLCATLQRFWYTRGYLSEGRRWTAHALTMVDQGLPLAEPRPADAPDAPQPAAMIGLHARVLNGGGALAWAQGDLAEAERFYARSLALRRELDDMVGVAATLNNLGAAAKSRGDDAQAIAYYEEALAIFRQLADRVNIARALSNLGWALVDQGDTRRARAVLEESLELRRQLGDTAGIATALKLLGDVAQHEEELAQAAALYEESLAMRWDLGDQEGVARSLEAMAQFAGVHGQPKRAARLWGAAEALRQAIGASLLPAERLAHERIVLAARQSFDPAEFDQAWAAGATMPLEQAVADARALRASRWGRITSPIPAGGTAQSRPPRRALRSPDGAHTIALDRLPLVIGRGQGCDVVIDDARVSRQHLRLSAPERAVVVTDLGSTNGTFVNGERVRERALRPGDTLSLGGLELVLVEGETNPAAR